MAKPERADLLNVKHFNFESFENYRCEAAGRVKLVEQVASGKYVYRAHRPSQGVLIYYNL